MAYVLVLLAALVCNGIPVFAPPTWTVLVALMLAFDLNPWVVVLVGVLGATTGRYVLGLYAPRVARWIFSRSTNGNLEYLGKKLSGTPASTVLFVFFYSLTPLSTSALFTAAAMAHTRQVLLLPPFFVAKVISYAILMWGAAYMAPGAADLWKATFSWRGLVSAGIGLVLLLAVLGIDWRAMLEHRKLVWRWRIWRSPPKILDTQHHESPNAGRAPASANL